MLEKVVKGKWLEDNYSSRVWKDKGRLLTSIETELLSGIAQGHNPKKIAEAMAEKYSQNYKNCERVARTETIHTMNVAASNAYKAHGIEKYEFLCDLSERTCEKCGALDGTVHDLKYKQEGVNYPVMHPNCRCTTIPHFEKDEIDAMFDESTRIAYDENRKIYEVPESMTYTEWKNGKYKNNLAKVDGYHATYYFEPKSNSEKDFNIFTQKVKDVYKFKSINPKLKQLDLSLVEETLSGINEIRNRFPKIKTFILSTTENSIAGYGHGLFCVNPLDYSNRKATENFLRNETGFVKGISLKGIGIHEAVHAVQETIAEAQKISVEKFSDKIISEAVKKIQEDTFGKGRDKEELLKTISLNSLLNSKEAISDTFVYNSNFNDNPFAILIEKQIEIEYNLIK